MELAARVSELPPMTITTFEARINVDVKAFDRLLIETRRLTAVAQALTGCGGLITFIGFIGNACRCLKRSHGRQRRPKGMAGVGTQEPAKLKRQTRRRSVQRRRVYAKAYSLRLEPRFAAGAFRWVALPPSPVAYVPDVLGKYGLEQLTLGSSVKTNSYGPSVPSGFLMRPGIVVATCSLMLRRALSRPIPYGTMRGRTGSCLEKLRMKARARWASKVCRATFRCQAARRACAGWRRGRLFGR